MQTIDDVVATARQIAADEDLAVEVTNDGLIRTTIENPRETSFARLHVGEQPIRTTDITTTVMVVTFEEDESPAEIMADGDGKPLSNESLVRYKIREALHDVHSNSR